MLPVAHIVPLFAWLESFHFNAIDECLNCLGLKPTGNPEESIRDNQQEVGDPIWSYIQKKYTAHAGFIAVNLSHRNFFFILTSLGHQEAMVEAVPQSILQTCACVILRQSNPVNIFSIMVSILVVASKGLIQTFNIR